MNRCFLSIFIFNYFANSFHRFDCTYVGCMYVCYLQVWFKILERIYQSQVYSSKNARDKLIFFCFGFMLSNVLFELLKKRNCIVIVGNFIICIYMCVGHSETTISKLKMRIFGKILYKLSKFFILILNTNPNKYATF